MINRLSCIKLSLRIEKPFHLFFFPTIVDVREEINSCARDMCRNARNEVQMVYILFKAIVR